MKNQYSISIITINRNNAEGLRRTIESVVLQTYFDKIEYIVIDGNSTDDSVGIIKEYSEQIAFWVSEPDNGIYDAMNKGIVHSNGDYILFLNSGDYFVDSSIIQKVIKEINTHDVVYFDLMINNKPYLTHPKVSLKLFTYDSLPHNASFIRSELLKERMYQSCYRVYGDMEWFVWLMVNGGTFKKINIPLIHYDTNGISSITRGKEYEIMKKEKNLILERYFPAYILEDYMAYTSPFMGFVLRIEKLSTSKKKCAKWMLRIWLAILELKLRK